MRGAIVRLELDLRGMTVLTEAASGPFAVTPLIAALAGASKVIALTADSRYGGADEVTAYVKDWASALAVSDQIEVTTDRSAAAAAGCNIVTNLGFVRPIDASMVDQLPQDAAVALMWEPWEYRESDIDIAACRRRDILVMGTCETDERVETFHYVGLTALKLLLECEIEIYRSRILVVSEAPFLDHICKVLETNGATVFAISVSSADAHDRIHANTELTEADAVVIADHVSGLPIVGANGLFTAAQLRQSSAALVHICGSVDDGSLARAGVVKHPSRKVAAGYMTVTADYVGARPVVDLHAAGLKVGEYIVRSRRAGLTTIDARRIALESGLALDLPSYAT